jgi:hypothetical protein
VASLSGALLFNGKPLRNASGYDPNRVVYSGSSLPPGSAEIETMMANLRNAYSGSDIRANQNIAAVISANTGTLATLGSSIIAAQLGGNAAGTVSSTNPSAPSGCSASAYSGMTVTALGHGESLAVSKAIANGTGSVTASCANGSLSYGSLSTACAADYVSDAIWSCTLGTCSGTAPVNSQVNGNQGTAAWAYSTTAGVCKFVCQAGYYWNGSNACVAAEVGNYVVTA